MSDFEWIISEILKNDGNRAKLADFINQWPPAPQWVSDHISERQKLDIIYSTDPDPLLLDIVNSNMDAITEAEAMEPSLTLQDYITKLTESGLSTSVIAAYEWGNLSDEFALAEHHLYGSSRWYPVL